MDLRKQVNTAGAFTLVDDLFIFMVGVNRETQNQGFRVGLDKPDKIHI